MSNDSNASEKTVDLTGVSSAQPFGQDAKNDNAQDPIPQQGSKFVAEDLLEENAAEKKKKKPLFSSGSHVCWQNIMDAQGNQHAFIGLKKGCKKLTQSDAAEIISQAKKHGWTDIDLHGNQKQKELLWAEAQRQGLNVTNFQPLPGSTAFSKFSSTAPAQKKPAGTKTNSEQQNAAVATGANKRQSASKLQI